MKSSKPFETVVAELKAKFGRLDLVEFATTSKSAGSFSELEKLIGRNHGSTGLMLFEGFDHGAVLREEEYGFSRNQSDRYNSGPRCD